MTFEDIQRANAQIVTTNIKGKEYAEVNQRIKAFRMVYPTGFITTEIVGIQDGICTMKAYVGYHDNGQPVTLGTGTAYEKESSSYINKTSYIENCETSAVGRALGMAGFGIDTSVASYEEVANAINNQTISEKDWKNLQAVCKLKEINTLEYIKGYGYTKGNEIKTSDYVKMLKEVSG